MGRWHGVRRDDRACKDCGNGKGEDIDHFVVRCEYLVEERLRLERLMVDRWTNGMSWVTMKRW